MEVLCIYIISKLFSLRSKLCFNFVMLPIDWWKNHRSMANILEILYFILSYEILYFVRRLYKVTGAMSDARH